MSEDGKITGAAIYESVGAKGLFELFSGVLGVAPFHLSASALYARKQKQK